MAYVNDDWQIVSSKVVKKKYIKSKEKPIVWRRFHYVWKTRATWTRIVLYDGKIIDYNKDTWICRCEVLDRNIKINKEQKIVEMDIPLSAISLD